MILLLNLLLIVQNQKYLQIKQKEIIILLLKLKNESKNIEKEIIHTEKKTTNFILEKHSKDRVNKNCDNEK